MINLIGTYECKVDAKGRLPIPSVLKKQLEAVLHDGFVVKRSVFQSCLEIYPLREWEKEMDKLAKLNRYVKKNNDFIRRFTAGVKKVTPDTTGRIALAKDLLKYSSINKQVVLATSINIIEVWDKELYENFLVNATSDFADLAEDVMGKNQEDELS